MGDYRPLSKRQHSLLVIEIMDQKEEIKLLAGRIESLKWLREVEHFKLTYAWPKWWSVQCTKAICELNEIHSAARAACQEV